MIFLFNFVIIKMPTKKFTKSNKIKIKILVNYILISYGIWELGGINNPSFHIFHSFAVLTAVVYINKIYGVIVLLSSSIFFVVLMMYGLLDIDDFIFYEYILAAGLFIGVLIENQRRNNRILDRKVKEFKALYEISKIIDTFPSTQKILDNISERVAKTLEIDECLIMLYDEKNDVLSTRARYGNINPEMVNAVFEKGEGVPGKVLETKESVISSDLEKDTHILKSFKYDFGIKSCAIIPLINNNNVIGVIAVYSKGKYEFTKDNIELLDIIASRITKVLENNKLYNEVKENSITDGLTRLYNYRYFYQVLKREMQKNLKQDKKIFVIMIDIDKFKQFNDKYGHIVGDKVLREIANIIKENIRRQDHAARYGGEEFAIILPDSNIDIARKVAERIKEKVKLVAEKIEELKGKDIFITVSVGIACYPHCAQDIISLIEKADKRMYSSKESGGDNVVYEI